MNKNLLLTFLIFLTIGLIACGSSSNDEQEDITNTNDAAIEDQSEAIGDAELLDDNHTDETNNEMVDLDEEKEAILLIEGFEEPIMLHLYNDPEFDFSAYVPEDMIGEFEQSYLNVYTNYDNQKNEDARLFITKDGEQSVMNDLEANGFTLESTDLFAYDFSEDEFHLEKEGFIGRVMFATIEGQSYTIGYYYPNEFADGFSARSALIIDHIVWCDS